MVGQQLPMVGRRPTAPTPGDATTIAQRATNAVNPFIQNAIRLMN